MLVALALGLVPQGSQAADLSARQIIEKARAAITKDPQALNKIKGVRYELRFTDPEKNPLGLTILDEVGVSRRQVDYNKDYTLENITASNGLEGWAARRNLANGQGESKIIGFAQVARMREMTTDELSFFAAPAKEIGSVKLIGKDKVNEQTVYALEYRYKNGFAVTRFFNTENFKLVAYDQKTEAGQQQRQQVEEFTTEGEVTFVKREKVFIDGKVLLDVTYEKITLNPSVSEDIFTFPVR
ncbi:MAG: hypothetical protein EBS00_06185 [Verrucomicrobia bacterium]|nr:hypothetical protein [Verrucomicrobiota bacterium]